ncbi:amidohydrolase [Candidatus Bathyarchaeota archaeon RBG_13_52_12]|nr:MAG: amidohydrolase [Candidatus Bathyarchaeota archaeon RBG_13_52_12]
MTKEKAWGWIDENKKHIVKLSDRVWEYAELGLVEERSSKLLADELERNGFEVERGVAGMPTAFVAKWSNGEDPTIGLMGEYDALPGLSNEKVPLKEPLKPGAPGHGCGHNIHGVTAVAAAIATRHEMEEAGISGTLKMYGCPAEENYDAKVFMVRAGLFRGVDACLSHHPGSINTATIGSSTAVNGVKFHYYGKTSHAASSPEQGRSALDAVELMNIGVNYIREHVIQEARFHYVIEVGGGQPNVVPDYARSWYYIRAPERDQLDSIYKRILRIADGAALMTETTLKVEFIMGLYNLIPNKTIAEAITGNMKQIGAPQHTPEELEFAKKINADLDRQVKIDDMMRQKVPTWERYADMEMADDVLDPFGEDYCSAGSIDVGDVSWVVPAVEYETATYPLGSPAHSWQWVACGAMGLGHKSLIFSSKVTAGTVIDLLTKPELVKKSKEEHSRRLEGKKYVSPIPIDIQPPLKLARDYAEKNKGKD